MRKILLSGPWLLSILVFISCQKRVAVSPSPTSGTENQVNQWLNSIKQAALADSNRAKIQTLQDNLNFSALRFEDLRQTEKFIIIPIKSTKLVPVTPNATNCLVLILNSSGKIRKGTIAQYTDDVSQAGSMPLNFFSTIYSFMPPENNPRLAYYSIIGRYLFDLKYKSGSLYSTSCYSNGNILNKKKTASNDCTDWYLVTTITYGDGSTDVSEVYLYTTCDGNGGGGGGTTTPGCGDGTLGLGEGDDMPMATTFPWQVVHNTNNLWYVNSYENFQGVKSSACQSSGGGYFTSITHDHSAVFNSEPGLTTWAQQYANVALTGGSPKTSATSKVNGKLSTTFGDLDITGKASFTYSIVFP